QHLGQQQLHDVQHREQYDGFHDGEYDIRLVFPAVEPLSDGWRFQLLHVALERYRFTDMERVSLLDLWPSFGPLAFEQHWLHAGELGQPRHHWRRIDEFLPELSLG